MPIQPFKSSQLVYSQGKPQQLGSQLTKLYQLQGTKNKNVKRTEDNTCEELQAISSSPGALPFPLSLSLSHTLTHTLTTFDQTSPNTSAKNQGTENIQIRATCGLSPSISSAARRMALMLVSCVRDCGTAYADPADSLAPRLSSRYELSLPSSARNAAYTRLSHLLNTLFEIRLAALGCLPPGPSISPTTYSPPSHQLHDRQGQFGLLSPQSESQMIIT